MLQITTENAVGYLIARGWMDPGETTTVTEFSGGVSSTVIKVETTGQGAIVLKQALPKLKVNADWFSDPSRIANEVACLRVLEAILEPGQVPVVHGFDPDNYAYIMSCAPANAVTWKSQLMRGTCSTSTATAVGRMLGTVHVGTRGLAGFEDREHFYQLRISPYFEYTAAAHPDLQEAIGAVVSETLDHSDALVHGDFSPKNILVDGEQVILLDCEVAHRGDPAFDLGFCVNHLLLKGVYKPGARAEYFNLAAELWDGYEQVSGIDLALRARTARLLGCLLLARVDGKSPVEYLLRNEADSELVRRVSRSLIQSPTDDLQGVVDRLESNFGEG